MTPRAQERDRTTSAPRSFEEVLAASHVVVCCGSGGVGKTTTAAVIALHAARQGRRAVVVTIDPARRLADALVETLLEEGRHHAERRALEDSQRALVEELDVPSYELPRLPGGIDMAGLYELAEELTEQGMA